MPRSAPHQPRWTTRSRCVKRSLLRSKVRTILPDGWTDT